MTVRPHTGVTVDLRRGWRFVFARRKKFIAAAGTVTSALLAEGLLPKPWDSIAAAALAAGGLGVVHQAQNARR